MTEPFDAPPPDDPDEQPQPPEPIQGQVRFSHLSARVPPHVGSGVFSNGVMILMGAHECVLDFVQRLGEPHRIVSRVVLSRTVVPLLALALRDNIRNYEARFGRIPFLKVGRPAEGGASAEGGHPPDVVGEPGSPRKNPESSASSFEGSPGFPEAEGHSRSEKTGIPQELPEPTGSVMPAPDLQDIYDELRLPDDMLSGAYANFVLIRHNATEFCFDFISNIYPRSAVSARVYMAAPHVPGFLLSLTRSIKVSGS